MEYLKQFISELISILTEMSPYLLLGFLMAGILYLLFPKSRVKQFMGRDSRGAVINASLLGIPLPLCSCGVIPTGISFYKNGASKGSTVSFLSQLHKQVQIQSWLLILFLGYPLQLYVRQQLYLQVSSVGLLQTGQTRNPTKTLNNRQITIIYRRDSFQRLRRCSDTLSLNSCRIFQHGWQVGYCWQH